MFTQIVPFKHQGSRSMAEASALKFYSSKCDFSSDLLKILSKQGQAGSIQNDILAKGKLELLDFMFLIFTFEVSKNTVLLGMWFKSQLHGVWGRTSSGLQDSCTESLSQGRESFRGSAHGAVNAWPHLAPPGPTWFHFWFLYLLNWTISKPTVVSTSHQEILIEN